jgi:hypothetical protein
MMRRRRDLKTIQAAGRQARQSGPSVRPPSSASSSVIDAMLQVVSADLALLLVLSVLYRQQLGNVH